MTKLQFNITMRGQNEEIKNLLLIYQNIKTDSTEKKFSSLHEFCLIHVVKMITQLLDGSLDFEFPSKQHWDPESSITLKFTFPLKIDTKDEFNSVIDAKIMHPIDRKLLNPITRKVIILAENNFPNRQLKRILTQSGFTCDFQSDYMNTLENIILGKKTCHFIFIDATHLNDIQSLYGKGYIQEISKKVKIILMIDIIQHFESMSLQKRFHAHASIFKPISTFEIIKLIHNLLSGSHINFSGNDSFEKIESCSNPSNQKKLNGNYNKKLSKPGMILIADKNEVNLKIMEAFLRIRGWQVFTVTDHEGIFDYIVDHPVDLVMISYEMAFYEDFLTLDLLKKRMQKVAKKIPLILIKDKNQSSFETIISQKNIDGTLNRPIKAENLHNIIHQQLKDNPNYKFPNLDKMTLIGSASGDIEILKEIASYFIQSIPDELNNIKTLTQENRWSELADKAHQWKGSVSQFGAVEATELLKNLEEASELHDKKEVKHLIIQIDKEMERLCEFFSAPGWEKFL